MSARSFTVFQDSPTEILQPDRPSEALPLAVAVPATDATATLVSTLAAIEKENLHPLTGERTGPASCSESKKRKTAVLSTKLLVDLSKKQKEHKSESTKKQRKQPSLSGKSKSSDARKSSQSKRRRSPRKASPLPSVQEEPDVRREPSRLDITQATINSRCYELTVSPLADVSEAYETVSQSEQDSPSDDVCTHLIALSPWLNRFCRNGLLNKLLPVRLPNLKKSKIQTNIPLNASLPNSRFPRHLPPQSVFDKLKPLQHVADTPICNQTNRNRTAPRNQATWITPTCIAFASVFKGYSCCVSFYVYLYSHLASPYDLRYPSIWLPFLAFLCLFAICFGTCWCLASPTFNSMTDVHVLIILMKPIPSSCYSPPVTS